MATRAGSRYILTLVLKSREHAERSLSFLVANAEKEDCKIITLIIAEMGKRGWLPAQTFSS